MKRWTISAATVLALVLPSQAAWALTPEEVWDSWKAGVTASGGSVTTRSETREGDALVISGIGTLSGDLDGTANVQMQIDRLTLTGRSDGTVAMTMSDMFRVDYRAQLNSDDARGFRVEIRQTGAETIASGTVDAITYDYTIAGFEAKLIELRNEAVELHDVQGVLTGEQLSGTCLQMRQPGGAVRVQSEMALGPMVLTVSGKKTGPAEERAAGFSGTMTLASAKSTFSGAVLPADRLVDIRTALAEGLAFDSKLEFGAVTAQFNETDNTGAAKGSFTAKLDGGDLGLLFDAARFDYGLSLLGGDVRAELPSSGLTDLGGAFTEVTLRMGMPLANDGVSQDFSFLSRLVDVTVSDYVWGLADPGTQLSRDPATLIVDLTGKGAWLQDFLVPGPKQDPSASVPLARIDQIDLKQGFAKLFGAQLDASGALSFDNSDTTTFQGFPAPDGRITVSLAGLSALLDKLVALGIVSANDLNGIRMAMAMFTRPGAGPDQLTTEIVFRNKGLFVNGQQLL
ncbi:DUF2125 domain-containing protein [Rhodobacter sp. 24-YEA-8]|uniref:DUF2125 domain-containing protein n=1 Tax=Rhodobacter sp. 24-YEA-8 TaxID=1884310 RepID=UPI001495C0CF|nr:DUF2125 domain-containing protein [Rhodobacter sp. 24-YEA-8]